MRLATPSGRTLPLTRLRLLAACAMLALVSSGCAPIPTLSTQQAMERMNIASTKLFAADGSLIANLHGEFDRDIVPLADIPRHVQLAVIAIEDQRFFTHGGVDLVSIGRALVSNAGAAAQETGRLQGGSTLSQQLVKNIYFQKPARTLNRKLTEARVTFQFERQYSKPKILEMYLNTIHLGRALYGLQTASRSYFDKDVADLTVSEAAFLAGIIRSPARYDWLAYPDAEQDARRKAAVNRRNTVLDKMVELGFLTPIEGARARSDALEVKERKQERWDHPYFADLVLKQLGVLRSSGRQPLDPRFDFLGTTHEDRARAVNHGGLRIYTTLDPDAQAAAEEAIDRQLPDGSKGWPARISASLAAIEPKTGYIRAIVGGRDYYPEDRDDCSEAAKATRITCRHGKLNLALGSSGGGTGRQPGSSFKPLVLATALQRGVSLRQTFDSSSFTQSIPGSAPWKVRNYEGEGGGRVDLVEGTVSSINAVYAHLEVDGIGDGRPLQGSARVADTARKLGIGFPTIGQLKQACGSSYGKRDSCIPADDTPAIALGAKEVSPIEMASAFSTFANEGVRVQPTAVARITDAKGKVLYDADPAHARVLPRTVALGVTHVLQQVIQRGTGVKARLGRPAAGKTGTAQEWRDAWFAGYVPQLAAVVWVGNPVGVRAGTRELCPVDPKGVRCEPESMTPGGGDGYPQKITGGSFPAMIWQYFMTKALAGIPVQPFPPAPGELFGAVTSTPVPTTAEVPALVGMSREAAVAALATLNLGVAEKQCLDRISAEGTVVKQEPAEGSEVRTGSTVTICVSVRTLPLPGSSASPRPGTAAHVGQGQVPSVVGMSRAEAMNVLSRAGYRSAFVRECSPDGSADPGRVWKQSPDAGASLEKNSTVTLWYAFSC